jgi:hypothetical protein
MLDYCVVCGRVRGLPPTAGPQMQAPAQPHPQAHTQAQAMAPLQQPPQPPPQPPPPPPSSTLGGTCGVSPASLGDSAAFSPEARYLHGQWPARRRQRLLSAIRDRFADRDAGKDHTQVKEVPFPSREQLATCLCATCLDFLASQVRVARV